MLINADFWFRISVGWEVCLFVIALETPSSSKITVFSVFHYNTKSNYTHYFDNEEYENPSAQIIESY